MCVKCSFVGLHAFLMFRNFALINIPNGLMEPANITKIPFEILFCLIDLGRLKIGG